MNADKYSFNKNTGVRCNHVTESYLKIKLECLYCPPMPFELFSLHIHNHRNGLWGRVEIKVPGASIEGLQGGRRHQPTRPTGCCPIPLGRDDPIFM